MAINAANDDVIVGGEYSTGGPDLGDYRVVVQDVALKDASTGTKQVVLTFHGKSDPDHPAKEGKYVAKLFQSLPSGKQDAEKRKQTQGFLKRMLYDGMGLEWPKTGKKFDPRVFSNKECYIRIGERDDNRNPGTKQRAIVAIAPTKDKLPVAKNTAGKSEVAKRTAATATR